MQRVQLLAALFGAAALSITATAQTPQPQLLSVARVNVKPDRIGEWLDVEKQYSEAYKKGGGTFRLVYRNTVGNPYEYMVVSALGKYAALDDEKSPYAKGTTDTELARMAARRAQCVVSVRTTYERSIPELSITKPNAPVAKRVRVTRVMVRPGMTDQYIAAMRDEFLPALKKAGVTSYLVRRVEWGGSRNQFTLRGVVDKFEELDGDSPLTKAMGKEGAAKWLTRVGQMISSSEYLIYAYVPESSYRPQQ